MSFNLLYSNNVVLMATSHGIYLCRNFCRAMAIQFWTAVLNFFYYDYYYYFEMMSFDVNIIRSKAEYLKF